MPGIEALDVSAVVGSERCGYYPPRIPEPRVISRDQEAYRNSSQGSKLALSQRHYVGTTCKINAR